MAMQLIIVCLFIFVCKLITDKKTKHLLQPI